MNEYSVNPYSKKLITLHDEYLLHSFISSSPVLPYCIYLAYIIGECPSLDMAEIFRTFKLLVF